MQLPAPLHDWEVCPKDAVTLQRQLAARVCRSAAAGFDLSRVRRVAGLDAAFTSDKRHCIAGVVLWDLHGQRVLEEQVVCEPLKFPYIPGLLSFREAPGLLAALTKLSDEPDALLFDGQGIAHPRRLGLAAHVGLFVGRPSVGCAKSRLIGEHELPGLTKGDCTALMAYDEQIGAVLRTRDRVKPLYISVGHLIDLPLAVALTLRCCTRYRLPEPTRLADRLVARAKRELSLTGVLAGGGRC